MTLPIVSDLTLAARASQGKGDGGHGRRKVGSAGAAAAIARRRLGGQCSHVVELVLHLAVMLL